MVIGEDLGTVPVEIVGKLAAAVCTPTKCSISKTTTRRLPCTESVSGAVDGGCGDT